MGGTFAGREFVEYLIENNLLIPRDCRSSRSGDLILYFDTGVFRHVGRTLVAGGHNADIHDLHGWEQH